MAAESCKEDVVFFLTGFGSFCGVAANPTAELVLELPPLLSKIKGVTIRSVPPPIRVSAKSCTTHELERIAEGKTPVDVWMHLGVHGSTEHILLERCAYNEGEKVRIEKY
jgi:pyrrolidone-carboxylate peptidase